MSISIITIENRRLYPAVVYSSEDEQLKDPIINIDDIYDLLYKKQSILVMSRQYDQYGKELKHFNGQLEKSDIKAIFTVINEEIQKLEKEKAEVVEEKNKAAATLEFLSNMIK